MTAVASHNQALTGALFGVSASGQSFSISPRFLHGPGSQMQTAIGSVFGTEAFPDATHFANAAPRAANDPRGPRTDEPVVNDELIEENQAVDA